jgi:hypothetical protein
MHTRNLPAGLLRATVATGTAMLLAACGSSSSTPSTSTPTIHTTAAAAHAAAVEAVATETAKRHRDKVSTGAVVAHHPLHGTGGDEINDDNPGKADVGDNPAAGEENPCRLVSQAQAQAILGRPVAAPQEAPLGPTCIYQPQGEKTFVTLTLEGVKLTQLKPHIRHLTQFELDGRSGYCGIYGQATTFVQLTDGKVLDITAPCNIGRLFAARALTRPQT